MALAMTEAALLAVIPRLTKEQVERFITYDRMLLDYNERVNLTRITEPDEVAAKHFADSILPEELIPHGAYCIDVGTGAGFPGVPLKIVRPDIRLVLLDSLAKRVAFLQSLCHELGFSDAECVHARAEDAAREPRFRAAFDIALSRAVAPMNVLTELTVPFAKRGGASLMYKGANADAELAAAANAMHELRCKTVMHRYDVPWGERTVMQVVKTGDTPAQYPRKAGMASKKPL